MTKTKNTVASETIVDNLKKFTDELHQTATKAMVESLIVKDEECFVLANFTHNISHALIDILQGKSETEALEKVFKDDEDEKEDGDFNKKFWGLLQKIGQGLMEE
ncbi:hypothetical protein [Streptococcus himalayensis]|uniref:Uncharacterized protein n=1 Tax=Streptococcus himalayensis TaxID=1888195 RepID=A0A917EF69_9STRE|nr:hypothetical protein [Streptococcus himalayensis]QBX25385.1 hypothetical protein Javan254_0030 [Streptococcus phage Javan254]GGE26412.1 hypothetical protein GCM10011510_04510 [Streptococcus himalayensis]